MKAMKFTRLLSLVFALSLIFTSMIFLASPKASGAEAPKLDWSLGYWDSGSGSVLSTNGELSPRFVSTRMFTKEEIPVGSVITIDSGYKYRPEGWISLDRKNSARPANVTTASVTVTEEWWGDFNYRAFNISTNAQGDISSNYLEVASHFNITLPDGTKFVHNEKKPPEFEWTLGFWDSASHFDITQGSDLANCFVASQRFTREDLPIGTVITIDSGYKYRPDGWIDLSTKNTHETKPGNVTTASVTVTEEWWGDFNYRGFNISTNAQGNISESYLEVASHFNITLPDGTKFVHPEPKKTPEFEWTLGYWDSSSGYVLTTGSDLANCFVASQTFTKEDLPVGTVITIDSGYKYRPDGWTSLDKKNGARPGNVTTASVTVTEEWWGDLNYRAFNISTNAQGNISENYLEVASHFNITLPDGTKYVHPKGADSGDTEDPEEPTNPVVIPEAGEGVLRLLSIGNSYSNDAQAYITSLAGGLGLKIEFYNLYYGGCTIDSHYNFYNNNRAEYDFYKSMKKYVSTKVTLKNALEATQYDYITFQQGSWQSDSYSSYANLDELMTIVRGYQPNAEFLIHQTWSYCEARSCNGDEANKSGKGYASSAAMFAKVEECYSKAAADNGNLRILRSGKAVQMAKTEYYFTDDYGKTNSIYSDFNSHLAPRGDYLAGCVWLETIFDSIDIRNTTYNGGFSDAALLREIAYRVVNGTDGAKISLGESEIFKVKPVVKTTSADGFDYDGRMKLTVYKASDSSAIKTYTQSTDGSISISGLPEGKYFFRAEKNGYVAYTSDEIEIVRDGTVECNLDMIPGDVKEFAEDFCGDGIVDIEDFIRVLKGFNPASLDEIRTIVDINGDGIVNVTDLGLVKNGFERQLK